MGSSASVSPKVSEEPMKPDDSESVNMVEKFTELAFEAGPKCETVRMILTNNSARKAFVNFMKNEKSLNSLKFLETKSSPTSSDNFVTENIISQYTLPVLEADISDNDNMNSNIYRIFNGERDFSNQELLAMLDDSRSETVLLLSLDALPRYLMSEEFKKWRSEETKRAIEVASANADVCVTIPEILAIDPTMNDTNFVEAEVAFRSQDAKVDIYNEHGKKYSMISNADLFASAVEVNNVEISQNSANESERDYIDEALKHVDYLEIDRIINSGNWLFAFVAAVENLPICITLSTARKERLGFPLIYVNKYFEVTSGYQRTEIMGANCKFLQRNANGVLRSEVESVERLSAALRNAEPVKAAITNFRRDGTPFRNLLSMKPVFDMKGVYQYVIGIQFDISSPKSNSFSLRIIDSLMNLLPNVVAS